MKNILNFFLLIIACSTYAQDFNNYKNIQSEGSIPQDMVTLSSDLYEKERKLISSKEKRFDKKAKEEFYLNSSFELHDMLYNGTILFNDPLTQYVQKVADVVFKSKPNLQKNIKIFVVRSAAVNAFATNNGMIFITMGLLAQIESEAQLAFILSHEFTHFEKKHVVNSYVETKKIKKGKKDYRSLNLEDKINAKYKFNKEQEIEADIDGLEMYLKTKYSLKVLDGVFDVLEYEYLPFDDIPFDTTFFNSKNLVLPSNLFLKKTRDITPPTENDDTKSTHPSIFKRRKYIADKISKEDNTGRVNYLVSEVEFKNIRKMARFELSQLYLTQQHYFKSIYNSFLLLKENPHSLYLKKCIAKSLYALAKYKNVDKLDELNFYPFDSIEGSSQQIYYLFQTLEPKDLTTIAIKYIWDLKNANKNDTELQLFVDDLIKDGISNEIIKKSDYSLIKKEQVITKLNETIKKVEKDTTEKEVSKYDKIKKNQKQQKIQEVIDSTKSFTYYAFVDDFNNTEFSSIFDKYENEYQKKKDEDNKKSRYEKLKLERKQKKEEQKRIDKYGYALGIDKIVMINPHYLKVDERKENSVDFLESEEAQLMYNDKIREIAPKAGLQVEMLDDIGLKVTDVDKFNDYGYLNTWFRERNAHIDNKVDLIALDKEKVDYFIKKYNTKYFCWSGFISEREKKEFAGMYIVYGILMYPTLPFMVYMASKPEYQTYYYNIIFDIETGKTVYTKISSMDYRDSNSLINSQVYDLCYQIKQKDKSKSKTKN
jgi:hypothetical protein